MDKRTTILVVEDEILIRFDIADTLRRAGYDVLEAATGDEARVLLAGFPAIAVVFTDVHMPGATNGAELAAFVRANYPRIGVLMTSGVARPAKLDASVPFVTKPYRPENILQRIRQILA